MRSRAFGTGLALLAGAGFWLSPGSARATEVCRPGHTSPEAVSADQALAAGERHLETVRSGNLDAQTRRAELQQAEAEFRSAADALACLVPLYVVRLGQTLALEGRYLAALAAYRRVTARRAELAQFEIYAVPLDIALRGERELGGRVAGYELSVRAPGCEDVVVLVDGSAVAVGQRTPHDPGVIQVEASSPNCGSEAARYTLREGETRRIELSLKQAGAASTPSDTRPGWFATPLAGLPRWAWLAGGAVVAGGLGVAGYSLLSPKPVADEVPPSGSWGRALAR